MYRWLIVLPLLFSIYPYTITTAASFDCDRATTANEKLICSNPELSDLDEAYVSRYRLVRQAVFDTKQVKDDAIYALKERDRRCFNIKCLKAWYANRITLYDLKLNNIRAQELAGRRSPVKLAGPQIDIAPHPVTLFNSLNLRSFDHPLSSRLRSGCDTYLSDWIDQWDFTKSVPASYTFGSNDTQISYTLIGADQAVVTTTSGQGDKPSKLSVKIAYSLKYNEWRGMQPVGKQSDTCREQQKAALKNSKPNRRNSFEVERFSVGEIALGELPVNQVGPVAVWDGSGISPERPYHKSETPLYAEIDGESVGYLGIEVYSDSIEGSRARVILVDHYGLKLATAEVLYRAKFYPSMLIFDAKRGWYRLNIDNRETPLWIHEKTTHPGIQNAFQNREHMVKTANEIKVRSAHRLRSGPGTHTEIVKVLEKDKNDLIVPLQTQGDWLKVVHVSPHPGMLEGGEEWLMSLDENYIKNIGWIKWRASPTEQYVDLEHHY